MAKDFTTLFNKLSSIKVGVIGDVMLDTYCWGRVDRISPEAPVPVVAVTGKEQRIGGAGNVALNIRALDAEVQLISVLGDDDDARTVSELLNEHGIHSDYLIKSKERITTNKTRIISRNQQMMRLDAELATPVSQQLEMLLIESFNTFVASYKPHIVILEDYNKGILTPHVIDSVIAICRKNNILTSVDPKRKNFFQYKHVDIFKPNLSEAKEGLNILSDDVNEVFLRSVHNALSQQLQHHISFITLSEKGVFYQQGEQSCLKPSHMRAIADVSGAGDTVIAVASLVYAATKDVDLMSEIANIAGGLVCEEVGTAAINKEKLMQECSLLLA